jgi:hypothetical protein
MLKYFITEYLTQAPFTRMLRMSYYCACVYEKHEGSCCIQGYHVYKEIQVAGVGEVLMCEREPHNGISCIREESGNDPRT